jgi:hypothetical protein
MRNKYFEFHLLVWLNTVFNAIVADSAANRYGIDSIGQNPLHSDEDVFLIKFLHPYTEYPVKLVDHTPPVLDTTVRWFKYGSNYFIDELDQHYKYFTNETEYLDPDLGRSPKQFQF